ncbi:hypothetical protein HY501_00445 [Candidatus Woesearchaeota archaeon]|nr:hypothetical protein [Candidatus Woesearchaeota archaeon]
MSFLSESLKVFKKDFWKFLVVDALFLFLAGVFFVFIRGRVMVMLAEINQYAGDLAMIEQQLQSDVSSIAGLDSILSVVEPLAMKLNLFVFFAAPALFLAVWSLLQHANYSLILKRKWFDLSIFLKMSLYSIIPFAFLIYSLNKILVISSWAGPKEFVLFWFAASFFVFYLLTLLYHFLAEKPKAALKKLLRVVVRRSHLLFPLFTLYAFCWLALLLIVMNLLILYIANAEFFSFSLLFGFLAALLALGFLRVALEKASAASGK